MRWSFVPATTSTRCWSAIARCSTTSRGSPGARRFEVERVRRGLLRLQRRLALREALGIGSTTDERERKHVELFLATLPPPVSRWVYALAIVAIACVARLFAAWIA